MHLGGDFWSAFTFTFVVGIVVSEVGQRTMRRARPGAAAESVATEDQDDLVARLAAKSRPGDRATRLLDQYEVAIQDRLLLHYMAKDEQSAERKSVLDASLQRMRLRQSAARSMVTQELLGATANPEKM